MGDYITIAKNKARFKDAEGNPHYIDAFSQQSQGVITLAQNTAIEAITTAKNAAKNEVQAEGNKITALKNGDITGSTQATNMIAPQFNSTTVYSTGQYVWYETTVNNENVAKLYRLTADHAANTSWENTSKVEVKLGSEVSDLKSTIGNLEYAVYDDRNLSVSSLTNGVFEASGYASLSSTKWVFTPKFESGSYRITPPTDWRFEIYLYNSDTSGTLLQAAFTGSTKTITANQQFVMSGRKNDNTNFTSAELEAARTGFSVVKLTDNADNLTRSVSAIESTVTAIESTVMQITNADIISAESWNIDMCRYEHISYTDLITDIASIDVRTSAGAIKDKTVKFQGMAFSVKQTTVSGNSNSEIRFTVNNAFTMSGAQEFEVCFYVEDASKVSQVSLRTIQSDYSKDITAISNGWNKVRFIAEGGGNYTTDSTTTIRLLVYTTYAIDIWWGSIVLVKPQYANLIVVADGPYKTFYSNAYPALSAINVPVTWALDCNMIGNTNLINNDELLVLSGDGFSEFSFHSFDGTLMSSATAKQALVDTVKNIRFLRKNGLQPNHIWRAAWLQNNCPNHVLADTEVEASATYNGKSSVTQFPWMDEYNIDRIAMQGRETSYIDTLFAKLKLQHCTAILYTHGISDAETDTSSTLLSYYVSKISTGISEGWLNPTTYSRLVEYYKMIH